MFYCLCLQLYCAVPSLKRLQGAKLRACGSIGHFSTRADDNFASGATYMVRAIKLGSLMCAVVLLATSGSGCFRDPIVRKAKFVELGNRNFDQGRYPQALIFYGRALQIDPKFAASHYHI